MHKAGFVNIVGNPNVGKSTLMNALVGERISIATFKAQTTRHRIMGIYNTDEMQIVFSDTPGVLKPNYKLQESMLNFSTSALTDADILLYVTDVVETPDKNNEFMEKVRQNDGTCPLAPSTKLTSPIRKNWLSWWKNGRSCFPKPKLFLFLPPQSLM